MMTNERSIDMPSMQQIVIVTVASVLLISTVAFSRYALASSYDDQDVLRISLNTVNQEITDLDVEEEAEAEDITMMTNQTTTNINTTDVEFLAIQSAQSGSISQTNETAYTLELKNVANNTILFSDRPERIEETISTSDFVSSWTAGSNSFESDVPNDALIVENTQTGKLEIAVIESFTPVYDVNTNTLTYTITGENGTAVEIPNEFGQSVLVIDMAGEKITIYIKGNDVPIS